MHKRDSSVDWVRAIDTLYFDFLKPLVPYSLILPHKETGAIWTIEVDIDVDRELDNMLGLEGCDQWHKLHLEASR